MTTEERHKYYCSRAWAKKKEAVKKRSEGRCERCWFNKHEQTHHLTYIRFGNERLEDLQGLCAGCHEFISGKTDVDPCEKTCLCPRCHHENFVKHELCDCCFYSKEPFYWSSRCLCGNKSVAENPTCSCIPADLLAKLQRLIKERKLVVPKPRKQKRKPTHVLPRDFNFGGFDFEAASSYMREVNFRPAWTKIFGGVADQIPTADQLRSWAHTVYDGHRIPKNCSLGSGGLHFSRGNGYTVTLSLKISKTQMGDNLATDFPPTASWEVQPEITNVDEL